MVVGGSRGAGARSIIGASNTIERVFACGRSGAGISRGGGAGGGGMGSTASTGGFVGGGSGGGGIWAIVGAGMRGGGAGRTCACAVPSARKSNVAAQAPKKIGPFQPCWIIETSPRSRDGCNATPVMALPQPLDAGARHGCV